MEQILNQLTDMEKFIVARWAYSLGKPLMEDAEYNYMRRMLEAVAPNNEYVTRTWSHDPCPTELLEKIGRKDLIFDVIIADKTESIPTLNTDVDVKNVLGNISGPGTLSMKHDGWNIQQNYYNGHLVNITTRGRSTDAIDVSKLKDYVVKEIPYNGKCKVVQELTISKANFVTCARLFNNVSSRSAVSTILAKPEYYHLLSFTAISIHGYELGDKNKFEVLKDWGFNVPSYYEVFCYSDLIGALKLLSEEEPRYGEPTDGVVYDGLSTHAIRLLAWEEPIYESFVKDYVEQMNIHRISPSIVIEPILRKGVTQRQLNITNWQRIIDNDLRPGSPIAFRLASGAIADFDENATRALRKQWEGRWEEYQQKVRTNEEIVRAQWNSYLMHQQ